MSAWRWWHRWLRLECQVSEDAFTSTLCSFRTLCCWTFTKFTPHSPFTWPLSITQIRYLELNLDGCFIGPFGIRLILVRIFSSFPLPTFFRIHRLLLIFFTSFHWLILLSDCNFTLTQVVPLFFCFILFRFPNLQHHHYQYAMFFWWSSNPQPWTLYQGIPKASFPIPLIFRSVWTSPHSKNPSQLTFHNS